MAPDRIQVGTQVTQLVRELIMESLGESYDSAQDVAAKVNRALALADWIELACGTTFVLDPPASGIMDRRRKIRAADRTYGE